MRAWNWPRAALLAFAGLGVVGAWWCLTHPPREQTQPAAITSAPSDDAGAETPTFVGRWRSTHGDDTTLEVTDGMISFSRAKKAVFWIGYDAHSRYAPDLAAWIADSFGLG